MFNSIKSLFSILLFSILFSCNKTTEKIPLPPVVNLGPDKIEVDGTTTMLDAGNNGAAFLWSTGATSQTITVNTAGSYWVRVTIDGLSSCDTIKIIRGYELVKLETSMGNILMWLYNRTPNHKQNFFKLVKQGFFNDFTFNRVIDNFVIQGGCPDDPDGYGDPQFFLDPEFNSQLKHVFGAVGAGRDGDDTNPEKKSNTCQFYIVEKSSGTHYLDNNYTVFAIVIDGMPVVTAIANVPTDANDTPLENIPINAKVIILTEDQLLSDYGFSMPD
jgi:peptidyl-prolyl cis-trans isomerase B (cyclophilin B)